MREFIDVVFDGPPDHNAGRFVEVEDQHGYSVRAGEWVKRPDGYWALRLTTSAFDDDPTRWCNACGARTAAQCKCGPIAANE
jgi:hypothetical protein